MVFRKSQPCAAGQNAPPIHLNPAQKHHVQHPLTSCFWSGDTLRSRSVGDVVLCAALDVPALSARLMADCNREALRLELQAGDVEALSLPRARTRWLDYRRCVQAVDDWTHALGLPDVLAASSVALMACRGAKYHHDAAQYSAAAFCNLFLSEDKGLDLHFPATDQRIPLTRGTAVIFDTGQPHAVIQRGSSGFDAADFVPGQDCSQFFLTWELPIEEVGRALGVAFDIAPANLLHPNEAQLWLNGLPATVCPDSGRWRTAGPF